MTEPAKPPAPDLVPVRAPDGSVGTVPRGELAQALDAGAQVVDDSTLAKAKLQADYGGAGGMALAAGAGLARGATLGLSDVAATAIGGDAAREELNNLKEANPYSSIGGELVGAIAPAFLSGGASAAGEGLTAGRAIRGLGALPRGVSALGGLAERGAAGVVGDSLLGRVASRAVGGAVEGAAYGTGSALSEDALGDHEFTAESLLTGMKHGIIAGGLLGAAGGLFSRGTRAAQSDIETVAARHLGDASPGLAKAAKEADGFDSAVEGYINRTADSPEQAKTLSEAWKRREQLLGKHEQTLEDATRKVTTHLDDAIKAERAVDSVSFGEAKSNQMAKLVDSTKWRDARDVGLKVWEDASNTIRELSADVTKGGAPVAVNRASKWLEKFGKQLGETATGDKEKVAAEIFSQLDDFKRAIGKEAQFGSGPFGLTEAAREFDSLYHRVRGALENEDVWGKAATAQREVNQATQARLATRNQFGANFTAKYGAEMGRPTYVADPAKASAYVRNLTSAKNDLKHRAIQDYITNEENFLATVERHYDIPPAEKAQIAKAREAFSGLRKTIDNTSNEVSTINQIRQLKAEEQQAGLGGILGLATDIGTRPLKTLERLAAIENTAKRVDETIRKNVGAFFRSEKVPTSVAGESSQAEYDRIAKQVKEIANDPERQAANIGKHAETIADVAPKTAGSMATTATRAATFLASKLPPERIPADSLTPHLETPRVSDAERDRFLRYARAAYNPASVPEDLARGRISREAVEAMQFVAPRMYARTAEHINAELQALKKPLPYQKELQLKVFLQRPAMDPGLFGVIQDGHAASREEKRQRSQNPVPFKLTNDVRSASERVETR